MQKFEVNSLQNEITIFIRGWFQLLANDKFEEAILLLDHDSTNPFATIFDRKLFDEILNTYYWNGYLEDEQTRFSDPYLLGLKDQSIDFLETIDGSGIYVYYKPPVNGMWSDLTAEFLVRQAVGDQFYVYLLDLHVL